MNGERSRRRSSSSDSSKNESCSICCERLTVKSPNEQAEEELAEEREEEQEEEQEDRGRVRPRVVHIHVLATCGHRFHARCLREWMAFSESAANTSSCPNCRGEFSTVDDVATVEMPVTEDADVDCSSQSDGRRGRGSTSSSTHDTELDMREQQIEVMGEGEGDMEEASFPPVPDVAFHPGLEESERYGGDEWRYGDSVLEPPPVENPMHRVPTRVQDLLVGEHGDVDTRYDRALAEVLQRMEEAEVEEVEEERVQVHDVDMTGTGQRQRSSPAIEREPAGTNSRAGADAAGEREERIADMIASAQIAEARLNRALFLKRDLEDRIRGYSIEIERWPLPKGSAKCANMFPMCACCDADITDPNSSLSIAQEVRRNARDRRSRALSNLHAVNSEMESAQRDLTCIREALTSFVAD